MIGERIKELRKKNKYTQAVLADKLNVTQGAVTQWENGIRTPDIEMTKK